MFAILYGLYNLIGATINGTKCIIDNEQAKARAYQRKANGENPAKIYIDRKGTTRDLETSQYARVDRDELTGDQIVLHGLPPVIVRNMSEEWRYENYCNKFLYPEYGRTVVIDISIPNSSYRFKKRYNWKQEYACEGQWYKDLKTGKLYVVRSVNVNRLADKCSPEDEGLKEKLNKQVYNLDFYMDINTRELVRLCDEFIELHTKDERPEDVVEYCKEAWKKMIKSGTWNSGFWTYGSDMFWDEYYFNDDNVMPGKRSRMELESMGNLRPCRYPM